MKRRHKGVEKYRHQAGVAMAAVIILVTVVLGSIGLITFLVFMSQPSTDNALVPLDNPDTGTPAEQPATIDNGKPANFTSYTNAQLGFSFDYPEAWGRLSAKAGSPMLLDMAAPAVASYSLGQSLEVQAQKLDAFRIRANDQGVIVQPQTVGEGYQWLITDKGSSRQTLGKPVTPAPPIVYRSGKALVYGFSATEGPCNYTIWAFAAQGNFIRIKTPAFCISDKPGDASVQADHKADFDKQKDQTLKSITVL